LSGSRGALWAIAAILLLLGACASPTGQPQPGALYLLDSGSPWQNPNGDAGDDGKGGAADTATTPNQDVAANKDVGGADAAAPKDAANPADASKPDAGPGDTGAVDSGPVDTGAVDSGAVDSGPVDSGPVDSGTTDTVKPDAGSIDVTDTVADSGPADTGTVDVGPTDTGKPDVKDAYTVPFGSDIEWGSEPDAKPYDAGQWEYDIKDTGGTSGPGPGLCSPSMGEVNIEKKVTGGKADIIIFVDTSGSMGQETKWVGQQLNNFANYLINANIDFVVIMIQKDTGCCKLCIQPPLGGNGCKQNNPPKFIHNGTYVSSTNGLVQFINSYPQWKQWLRPDATKNIVAVTDDNSYKKNPWFEQQIQQINNQAAAQGVPVQFKPTPQVQLGFVFHSIVAYNSKADCPTLAKKGDVYLQLTAKTNGAKFKICLQNWTPIFKSLANAVKQTAKPGCTYPMKKPKGVSSASDLIISYHDQKVDFDVGFAKGNNCPANGEGYTFDNPQNPSQVTLCPASCAKLSGGGDLLFNFGCM